MGRPRSRAPGPSSIRNSTAAFPPDGLAWKVHDRGGPGIARARFGVDERLIISELQDDAVLTAVLEPQRRWAAYALCDLEPPHRQYARFLGAMRDGVLQAVVLIYCPPGFTSVLPCGAAEDVAAILASAEELPPAPLLIVHRGNRAAVERRYLIHKSWMMLRMVVQPDTLKPTPAVAATVVALG